MNGTLLVNGQVLQFTGGTPANFSGLLLPQAVVHYASSTWGSICLQELDTNTVFLRHIYIDARQNLLIQNNEIKPGLQSILAINGAFQYLVKGLKKIWIQEKEFCLLNRGNRHSEAFFAAGRHYTLLNIWYDAAAHARVLSLFPSIQKTLNRAFTKAFFYLKKPVTARFSVHDAVQAIFYERYLPHLQKAYIELRMEAALFSLLAQVEAPEKPGRVSAAREEKAMAARTLMLDNLMKHLTIKQISEQLNFSSSAVKKAFGKMYGMGPYEFIREHRMLLAKQRLLNGESLKVVAIEMGIKPRNFSKEFKSFFGYTVSNLLKAKE